jgi:AcrR family transcriptional regulator
VPIAQKRSKLSPERVITAGIELADAGGIESLSMRRVGERLGVEAMSLYNHVANKDALIDGMVDVVFSEIDLPVDVDWRTAMQTRGRSALRVLERHPWATPLMESRKTPGLSTLAFLDRTLGILRSAGFTVPMTAHAISVLDAYHYGFALQRASLPFETPEETVELANSIMADFPVDAFPYLAELTIEHVLKPGYDYLDEFEFGLDLILDALAPFSGAEGGPSAQPS